MNEIGLHQKYIISVKNAAVNQIDPHAQYFVLRVDTDPAARAALVTYAAQVESANPQLAQELREWVDYFAGKIPHPITGLYHQRPNNEENHKASDSI
jgi:hypothetical protein